ncbi:MAG: CotH kinase family protein, partial [Verrucomicrobiae bacterium]|nr:CotH kinase family protein [Verrucomicrobiae bacterium]
MKSFAVVFREAYGGFDRSPPGLFFGPDTQGSREWLLMAAYESSQFNNELATEMAGRLGCRVSRSAPAVLTMNGTEVLAPYFICEHQSPDFIENRYGLKDIDWYRLKGGKEPPESFIEWRRWQRRDRFISLTEEAARFDLDDLCGWVLAMSFTSTTDNDQGAYFRDRESPDSRWQTLSWDLDAAFNTGLYTHKGVTVDCSKQCFEILYGERARLFFRLMEGSPEFRSYFRQFAETRL